MLGAYFYVSFEKQKSKIISEGSFCLRNPVGDSYNKILEI
jgi:hypothetical protein